MDKEWKVEEEEAAKQGVPKNRQGGGGCCEHERNIRLLLCSDWWV
jgi:hypothetical protein